MRKLLEQRHTIRQNFWSIIGFCLCMYFSYHAVFSERSVVKLMKVDAEIVSLNAEHAAFLAAREALERDVMMMRPGSLNRDMVEERVRYVLGYVDAQEKVVLGTN